MEDDNIMDEVERIVSQYALRKSNHTNVSEPVEALANSEIKDLLIEVQQLVKSLEDAYWEAITQWDKERALQLYESIRTRPRLLIDDSKHYDELGRAKIETAFIARAKLWIREAEERL